VDVTLPRTSRPICRSGAACHRDAELLGHLPTVNALRAGPFSVVIAVMSLPCGLTSGEVNPITATCGHLALAGGCPARGRSGSGPSPHKIRQSLQYSAVGSIRPSQLSSGVRSVMAVCRHACCFQQEAVDQILLCKASVCTVTRRRTRCAHSQLLRIEPSPTSGRCT